MFTNRRLFLVTAIIFSGLTLSQAQQSSTPSAPVVTASGSAERVRFTAPSNVVRMQLQVFSQDGQVLFDVNSKGNVLDWSLQDSSGQRLVGTYLTLITVKTLSGRVSERIGSVSMVEKQVELQQLDAMRLSVAQQQALGPVEENATLTILKTGEAQAATVVANNGNDGLIIRDHGALSFRLGDFFSGKDTEQMRLTEEGNLGIGTDKPQAKLDVAGVVRTSAGIEFASGTDATGGTKVTKLTTTAAGGLQQTLADGTVVPNATGSGTQNHIAKWLDGAGTLGDATIFEDGSGNVGIGTITPQTLLQVGPNTGYGSTNGLLISNNLLGSQFDRAFQLAPRQTASPATNSVLMYALPTLNPGVTVPSQYGVFVDGKQGTGAINSYAAIGTGQGASLGATNNTHLLLGTATIPSGNFAIFDTTGFNSFFSGNVGVGTTTPVAKLDVTGNINTSTQYNIGGNRVLSISGSTFFPNSNTYAGVGAGSPYTVSTNSFFGAQAGSSNQGGANSFFGERAGLNHQTGDFNSFFGKSAGGGIGASSGEKNSFFGSFAGSVINGDFNSFFGQDAGATISSGNNNSFFGQLTGGGAATANSVTLMGYAANISNSLSNATAIGAKSQVTQSDSLVLGSINGTNGATANTKVGIGITAPSSVLHIVSDTEQVITASTNWTGGTWINFANTSTNGRVWNLISTGSTNSEGPGKLLVRDGSGGNVRMAFDTVGNVGIGTVAPFDKLQVTGDIRVGTGTTGCVKDADATVLIGTCSSDARFKRNITPFPKLLDQLVRLQPVHFYWRATEYPDKAFGKSQSFGLVAQEVEKVLPELVTEDEKGFKAVRYHELPLMMLQAIKEQQTQIRQQQTEIEKQQAEMTGQRSRIEVLKHLVCLDHPSADVCR